jgi:hypothetical protein
MSKLLYYFISQSSFYYSTGQQIFGGDIIRITMPNNDSSKSVIQLINNGTNYYTLNNMAITLNMNTSINATYQLILQGNLNDYKGDTTNQILVIIPIFNSVSDTIEAKTNSITQLSNMYITGLFSNIKIDETYQYSDQVNGLDLNQFLTGISSANFYNIKQSNINYNIIQFTKSNIWLNSTNPILKNLSIKPNIPSTPSNISVANNGGPISAIKQNDIYIDCTPTNDIGEPAAIYTSTNLDQLQFFKINDMKTWIVAFFKLLILLLVLFFLIKLFQFGDSTVGAITGSVSSVMSSKPSGKPGVDVPGQIKP